MAWKLTLLLFISAALQSATSAVNPGQVQIPPFIIPHDGEAMVTSTCSIQADVARKDVTITVFNALKQLIVPQCGERLWYRVAHLNMSDSSQQCPSTWREHTTHGIRVCARPILDSGSRCLSALYPVDHQYDKICGRIIGYQFGSTDAFHSKTSTGIEEAYVDGISITHGNPRNHIWTYAAASTTNANTCSSRTCPCSSISSSAPPSYVGSNYYCESAYDSTDGSNCFITNRFFPNDPLWDGQQCDNEGTCCTGANTPPWFSVSLRSPTSDDIEVRICGDEETRYNEDTPIQLLEIYVQYNTIQ